MCYISLKKETLPSSSPRLTLEQRDFVYPECPSHRIPTGGEVIRMKDAA